MSDSASSSKEELPIQSINAEDETAITQDEADDSAANFILFGPSSSIQPAPQKALLKGWIYAFTRIHRIPVFKRVWLYLFLMALYTVAVEQCESRAFPQLVLKEASVAAYSGIVMGVLLVFRTNTAYERWAEGRKLWGQLVNDSRSLCLKVKAYASLPQSEKTRLAQLIISFAYSLKHHLRKTRPSEPLPGLNRADMESKHLPMSITDKIFVLVESWKRRGYIDGLTTLQLDPHLRAFMDICGACERIQNSPIAVSYRAFMRQGILLNLLVLPWFLSPEFSLLWCLPLILIGTYFLIGLELIAEDIEEPFGSEGDDLPLDIICGTIRSSVSEIMNLHKHLRFTGSVDRFLKDPLKH